MYKYWPRLQTPQNDAAEVAKVLREKYGFKTKVLLNATRGDILQALNEFQKELTEKDSLLIYYAGHGYLDVKIDRGYWVPIDGELSNTVNWISTFDVSDFLGRMSARHVLVVADSCYSGALTRSSLAQLEVGMSEKAQQYWFKTISGKRSRTVLSSGDLQPVLDTGGGKNSVFAKTLLEILTENNGILEGQRLYTQLAVRVAYAASPELEQIPRYATIPHAGHESGDFLFVPKQSAVSPSEQTTEGKETEKKEEQLSELPDEEKAEKEEQALEAPDKKKKSSGKQKRPRAEKEQPQEVLKESPPPEWGSQGEGNFKIRK